MRPAIADRDQLVNDRAMRAAEPGGEKVLPFAIEQDEQRRDIDLLRSDFQPRIGQESDALLSRHPSP